MVTNINIQLDDDDADFVRSVKEGTGQTWAAFLLTAAEAVDDRPDASSGRAAYQRVRDAAAEASGRPVEDPASAIEPYEPHEADVTEQPVEDDPMDVEADTRPSRRPQGDASGDTGPSWGSDPTSDDIARLESEIPGEPGTLDMERKVDAIIVMWDYLREAGKADKDAMMDAAAEEIEATGYADPTSFWSNVVKGRETLSGFDGVHKPPVGRGTWEYVDR